MSERVESQEEYYPEDVYVADEGYVDEGFSLFEGLISSFYMIGWVLQILCIVHVLKTRRPYFWIFIIFIASYLGVLLYFFFEFLPEVKSRPVLRSIAKKKKASKGDLKRLEEQVDFCATVEVQSELADAYLSRNEYPRAIELYRDCLKGVHADDEVQLYRLSEALHRNGEHQESLEILHKLKTLGYRDYEIYRSFQEAMCYAGLGNAERAVTTLQLIVEVYSGEEARFRMGEQLIKLGRIEEAEATLKQVIKQAKTHKGGTVGSQRRWVRLAKKALKEVRSEK